MSILSVLLLSLAGLTVIGAMSFGFMLICKSPREQMDIAKAYVAVCILVLIADAIVVIVRAVRGG